MKHRRNFLVAMAFIAPALLIYVLYFIAPIPTSFYYSLFQWNGLPSQYKITTPILKQLATATDVTIHTIDAVEQEALVRFYGIMTVPSTIWLDKMHRPAAINHGLTGLAQLRQQAQDVYAL